MRRAVIGLAGLAASTTLLVVVKGAADASPGTVDAAVAPPQGRSPAADGTTPSPGAPTGPSAGAVDPSAGTAAPTESKKAPTPKKTTKPPSGGGDTAPPPPPTQSRTVTGPRVSNQYGGVQVQIHLTSDGKRFDAVDWLEMPQAESQSQALTDQSAPQLASEAVRIQNSNLHTVSGATATSESYRQSLRGAIDKWRRGERD
jgi:hypothetical protein